VSPSVIYIIRKYLTLIVKSSEVQKMGFIVMTVESKLKERLLARGPFKSATSIAMLVASSRPCSGLGQFKRYDGAQPAQLT